MSAGERLQAALVASLKQVPALSGVAVFDAPPTRAAVPHVVVEEPLLGDWGTKEFVGREARLAILIADSGERPVRLRALVAAIEDAVPAMPRDLGGGWRCVAIAFARSRTARARPEGWLASVEFRVAMLRES